MIAYGMGRLNISEGRGAVNELRSLSVSPDKGQVKSQGQWSNESVCDRRF